MKRFVWISLFVVFASTLTAFAQPTATAPAAIDTPVSPDQRALALCDKALASLAAGDFSAGVTALQKAKDIRSTDPAIARAAKTADTFLDRREADEADRQVEFDNAVAKCKILLAIAAQSEQTKLDTTAVRDEVDSIRETVIDLMGAPRNEENITAADWYAKQLEADRTKIREDLDKIRTALEGVAGDHAAAIREGAATIQEALDTYIVAAAEQNWETLKASERSLDMLEGESEQLAQATDDLGALVSDKPWRVALDRLRLVKLVSGGDLAFLSESWASDIVDGAKRRAEAHQAEREWYDALGLYTMLADLYDNDGRYEKEVKYVTRRARVLSLYAPEEEDKPDLAAATKPAKPDEKANQKEEKWTKYVRGVDAFMVRRALARIDETYVKRVDYRDVFSGGLRAVKALVVSPEVAKTFPSLADQAKRDAFVAQLDSLIDQAGKAENLSYRNVSMGLNQVLLANRRTVDIPDEVIDVEFTDGMMKELDRFSSMIWPSEWPEFKKHTMGSFKGVGIQIQVQEQSDLLMVVSPLENSPAYSAGIKAGDFIMKIDGESAKGIDIEEAVKRITGPEGTKVVLTIKRPGRQDLFDATLERAEIHIQTVKGWKRTNGGGWNWMLDDANKIGYVRLTSFNRDTSSDLRKALQELHAQGVKGLILDLRSNPGGLLTEAVAVTDEFVTEGKIVSTKGRQTKPGQLYASSKGNFLKGELIVLVDQHSASAAEIVSGALKDLHRGTIVGKRSFGKGSVQNLIPIRQDRLHGNDAYLKLTTAYYYLPSDRCLHRTEGATVWGVEPDIAPVVTPRQMRRWLTLRRRTEIIKHRDASELEEDMTRQFRADIQLDTALLTCQLKLLRNEMAAAAGNPVRTASPQAAQ